MTSHGVRNEEEQRNEVLQSESCSVAFLSACHNMGCRGKKSGVPILSFSLQCGWHLYFVIFCWSSRRCAERRKTAKHWIKTPKDLCIIQSRQYICCCLSADSSSGLGQFHVASGFISRSEACVVCKGKWNAALIPTTSLPDAYFSVFLQYRAKSLSVIFFFLVKLFYCACN